VTDSRLRSIVVDCAHPSALARFWAVALGYTLRAYDQAEIDRLHEEELDPESDPSVVIDPPACGPTVWFNQVPEPKTTKNRVHIDINVAGRGDVEDLIGLGAKIIRTADQVPGENWFIMEDPEGNQFCVFPTEVA
jgi:hypothetical protein